MTIREKQILEIIKNNPMISQEEISNKVGITRSSVAVHISNLMKKGYIIGKGYVTSKGNLVSIVGGVNIDIGGKPNSKLIRHDSNPGKINITIGGVGRNIAHNLSLMGIQSKLFTSIGDDPYSNKVINSCIENNIDISYIKKVPNGTTPIYLYIENENGNMDVAISDMDICELINIPYLSSNISHINSSPLLLIDTNIPVESIEYLANNVTVPIFVDPVSSKKAIKLKNVLSKIHTLKPNKLEMELLSNIKIESTSDLIKASDILLEKGVKRLFITLGEDGVFACDKDTKIHIKPYPANVVNTTGAGDAFSAALIYSYVNDFDLETTCKYALASSCIAIESEETINVQNSIHNIESIINNNKIEIEYIK